MYGIEVTWYKLTSDTGESYRWVEDDPLLDDDESTAQVQALAPGAKVEALQTLPEEARTKLLAATQAALQEQSALLDKLLEDALKHPREEHLLDDLNNQVTMAIFRAEELDLQSSRGWALVARLEELLARYNPPGVARNMARDGVKMAKAKAEARRQHR